MSDRMTDEELREMQSALALALCEKVSFFGRKYAAERAESGRCRDLAERGNDQLRETLVQIAAEALNGEGSAPA